jgi:WD40 repeat protein
VGHQPQVTVSCSLALVFCVQAALACLLAASSHEAGIMPVFVLKPAGEIHGAALSPNGKYVAVAGSRAIVASGEPIGETEVVELWDVERKQVSHTAVLAERRGRFVSGPRFVRFSRQGDSLLVFDGDRLHLLRVPDLALLRGIEVELPPSRTPDGTVLQIDLQMTQDARRAALLVAQPSFHGGSLHIYDLNSGRLQRRWQFEEGDFRSVSSIAWSRDGHLLALTWLPVFGERLPRQAKNLLVLDSETGEVVTKIHTGYVAGPVVFGPDNKTVLTASLNPDERRYKQDTIRIWDIATGRMVREIGNPPEGIHYTMDVSADAQLVVAYVGLEKYDRDAHGLRNIYRKFRVWDVTTGRVVATSEVFEPELPEPHYGVPDTHSEGLQLALSADGTHVLVWWSGIMRSSPLLVYQVPGGPR